MNSNDELDLQVKCGYKACSRLFTVRRKTFEYKTSKGISPCCSNKCARLLYWDENPDVLAAFKRVVRTHGTDGDITSEYLAEIWNKQKGICPYTGLTMFLPVRQDRYRKDMRKASLDRIDPSKGHVKGNVQFVALAINLAKSTFSHEEMVQFIADIRNVNKTTNH